MAPARDIRHLIKFFQQKIGKKKRFLFHLIAMNIASLLTILLVEESLAI